MYQGPFYKRRLPKITSGRNYSKPQGFCRRQVILKHNRNTKTPLTSCMHYEPQWISPRCFHGREDQHNRWPKTTVSQYTQLIIISDQYWLCCTIINIMKQYSWLLILVYQELNIHLTIFFKFFYYNSQARIN